MKKILYIPIIIIITLLIVSCEDPVPNDYKPDVFVEAYLIAGEPIKDIKVMLTQPVLDSFSYSNAVIRDAEIVISGDGEEFMMSFDENTLTYFYDDRDYLVKPSTKYDLTITIPGRSGVITGSTVVPAEFSWIHGTNDITYYPQDTITPPVVDSLELDWENVTEVDAYFIRIKSLDTLGYGEYLEPPTEQENERIWRPYEERSRYYSDVTRWAGPFLASKSPFVWQALKWYGLNEVTVYAPDENFFLWLIQLQRSSTYIDLTGSISGGIGCFGSASIVRDTSFIVRP